MLASSRVLQLPRLYTAVRQYCAVVVTREHYKRIPVTLRNVSQIKYHVGILHNHVISYPVSLSIRRTYSFFSTGDTVFALSSGHGKCGAL